MRPVGRTREAVRRRKRVLGTAHCKRVRPTLATSSYHFFITTGEFYAI